MAFVLLFAFVLAAAIFSAALIAIMRLLGHVLLSISLAMLIGIAAAIAMRGNADDTAIPILLAIALVVPIFGLLRRRAKIAPQRPDGHEQRQLSREARTVERRPLFSRAPQSNAGAAWQRLEEAAPGHQTRLHIARRSCERFKAACEKRWFDLDAHRSLIILNKHLPDLMNQERAHAEELPEPARSANLARLVDLVERVAADCERQYEESRETDGRQNLLRRHIENYLTREALSPLKSQL